MKVKAWKMTRMTARFFAGLMLCEECNWGQTISTNPAAIPTQTFNPRFRFQLDTNTGNPVFIPTITFTQTNNFVFPRTTNSVSMFGTRFQPTPGPVSKGGTNEFLYDAIRSTDFRRPTAR